MSPVPDPRFPDTRWAKILQEDSEAAERAGRMDYVKPLVMLIVGGGAVMTMRLFFAGEGADGASGPVTALLYPVFLALALVFGVAGLWVAAKLWMGGAGPLGLAVLRLAGIYAMTDLIAMCTAPLMWVGWLLQLVCYVAMLAWLFELDAGESIAVALITFLLKGVAAVVFAYLIAPAF